MKRLTIAIAMLLFATAAHAFQARTGQWWNSNESGSGYNIDIQNGVLVVTVFSYEPNGDSEWYLAAAALTNGGRSFTGTLDKYRNGQCISCGYPGRPGAAGNDGTISINFTSETTATLTLPGGRTTAIVPYNFGYGDPPSGLLGEWVYFYDIISTFAERFTYTTTTTPTSTGNGVALDLVNNATCELQISGSFVGFVLCFDFNAALTIVENQYRYRYGLDETYGGVYTFPPSGNNYTMKGMRIRGSNGSPRATGDDPLRTAKGSEVARTANAIAIPLDAELRGIAEAMRQALIRAKQ